MGPGMCPSAHTIAVTPQRPAEPARIVAFSTTPEVIHTCLVLASHFLREVRPVYPPLIARVTLRMSSASAKALQPAAHHSAAARGKHHSALNARSGLAASSIPNAFP